MSLCLSSNIPGASQAGYSYASSKYFHYHSASDPRTGNTRSSNELTSNLRCDFICVVLSAD